MANFYLAVFIIGFALTVISFVMGVAGHSFGHLGDPGHGGDVGHGADAGEARGAHGASQGVPLLNFGTVTAFMTWFGGIGFLLTAYSQVVGVATIVLAVVGGLIGGGIIFVFMAKVLAPDQIPLNPADYHLPGTLGRITVTVPRNGTGEMVYTQAGTRKTVAARGAAGEEIAKGTEVVVLRYERGIAYARPWDQVAEDRAGPATSSR
jgi:membrane protein implicated in regulation of membrane protease activity